MTDIMIYVVGIIFFFSIVAVSKVAKMEDEIADLEEEIADLNTDLYDLKDIIRRRIVINETDN